MDLSKIVVVSQIFKLVGGGNGASGNVLSGSSVELL